MHGQNHVKNIMLYYILCYIILYYFILYYNILIFLTLNGVQGIEYIMFLSRFIIVFVLQENMESVKVEPDSDDETHQTSSQNEYCMTDDKDNYPVHAELFIVKGEREVSSHIQLFV
jgi:hypothetical protein